MKQKNQQNQAENQNAVQRLAQTIEDMVGAHIAKMPTEQRNSDPRAYLQKIRECEYALTVVLWNLRDMATGSNFNIMMKSGEPSLDNVLNDMFFKLNRLVAKVFPPSKEPLRVVEPEKDDENV